MRDRRELAPHPARRRSRPSPVCTSSQPSQLSRPVLATMTLQVPPTRQRPFGCHLGAAAGENILQWIREDIAPIIAEQAVAPPAEQRIGRARRLRENSPPERVRQRGDPPHRATAGS